LGGRYRRLGGQCNGLASFKGRLQNPLVDM
jgi:hypothetical protein